MYDVIMTNIEYSYKPGRFYIQYSTEHLVIVAFTCVFIVFFSNFFCLAIFCRSNQLKRGFRG